MHNGICALYCSWDESYSDKIDLYFFAEAQRLSGHMRVPVRQAFANGGGGVSLSGAIAGSDKGVCGYG
ncbi:hypothetical protein [uncultured Cohaesibacter sp.]|uniref:hypothetical protein n=1 Tax=uncultured Cohaesibacter sp. TaxID=1002546 RepID=UPI002AAAB4DD|nr:hypothetical protein [uncultured Cohaesibacter sp.]